MCVRKISGFVLLWGLTCSSLLRSQIFYVYRPRPPAFRSIYLYVQTMHGGRRTLHLGAVGGAGGDVGVVVGVEHRPRSRSLSDSGVGRDAGGADQARRLTSSTEADWGGRSHGGPGH